MSLVIGINGIEKNIGVTSTSLLLGQGLADISKKKVIIVDFDTEFPEIKTVLEADSINNYNIDNIMTYATMQDSNLEPVIKSNTIELLNSSVNIIYGTNFEGKKFSEIQISNLIAELKKMYDFVVLDLGNSDIDQAILNNSDIVLQVCIPSQSFIRSLEKNKQRFNHKTEFVLNMYSKGLSVEKHFKKIIGKEFIARLSYSKKVRDQLNKGYLDLEAGTFKEDLYDLIYMILEKFSMKELISAKFLFANEVKQNSSNFISKLFNKKDQVDNNNDRVKSPFANSSNNNMLGEVLVREGFITREQLDEALRIQSNISG